jgi:general stress protein YciG
MAEQRHIGNPGNFAADRERAARAGHVGGQRSAGNFARDPARAAEAGRKGGQRSSHRDAQGGGDFDAGQGQERGPAEAASGSHG